MTTKVVTPIQTEANPHTAISPGGRFIENAAKDWQSPKQIAALTAIREYKARSLDGEDLEDLVRQLVEGINPRTYDWGMAHCMMANIAIDLMVAIAEDPDLKIMFPEYMQDELPRVLKSMYYFFNRLSLCHSTEAQVDLHHAEHYPLSDEECSDLIGRYEHKTDGCIRGTVRVVNEQDEPQHQINLKRAA